jgi:site-specific recombinase XerD
MQYAKTNFNPSTVRIYENSFRKMLKIIGDKPINLLSFRDFELYKTERIKEVSKVSVNIEIRNVKTIFNYVIKLGYLKENPAAGIKQFILPQKEKLSFNIDDLKKLLSVIDCALIKNIVLFGLYTGCRINEILNIQVKNIDIENRWIDIINKPDFVIKTGKVRRIPISDELYDLLIGKCELKNYERDPESYLFYSSRTQKYSKNFISRKFKKYVRKAGLSEKYHFHCLRHTFITQLIKSGVNLNYVRELAGHKEIKTTMCYIHIETEDLREAVNHVRLVK